MITKTITKTHPNGSYHLRKKIFEIICDNSLTTKKLALAFHPDGKANANAKANANYENLLVALFILVSY